MHRVEIFAPDSCEVMREEIVFAETEDDAITQVTRALEQDNTEYGVCMAGPLND